MTKEEILKMIEEVKSMKVDSMATSMLKKNKINTINKYGKEYGLSI